MEVRTITLDINKNVIKKNKYKRYSKSSMLEIIIKEEDEEVDLSDYTATIYFKLPNDEILIYHCNIIDNKINVVIDDIILSWKGKIYFEIRLDNSVQVVTTFKRYLEIIE